MTNWNRDFLPPQDKVVTIKIKTGIYEYATYDYKANKWYLPDYDAYIDEFIVQGWTTEKYLAERTENVIVWLFIAIILFIIGITKFFI